MVPETVYDADKVRRLIDDAYSRGRAAGAAEERAKCVRDLRRIADEVEGDGLHDEATTYRTGAGLLEERYPTEPVPKSDTPEAPAAGTDQHARDERAEAIAVAGPSAGGVATVDGQDAGASTGGAGRDLGEDPEGDPAAIDRLIERSSLGSAEAKEVRARTPQAVARAIVEASEMPPERGRAHVRAAIHKNHRVSMSFIPDPEPEQPQPAPDEECKPERPHGAQGCSRGTLGCRIVHVEPAPWQSRVQCEPPPAPENSRVHDTSAGLSDAQIAELIDCEGTRALAAEVKRLREMNEALGVGHGVYQRAAQRAREERRKAEQERDAARADEAQAKLYAAEMKGKWVEARAEVERLTHMTDLYMISESAAQRERDEARAALARACELLRTVPDNTEHSSADEWNRWTRDFLAEHGGAK